MSLLTEKLKEVLFSVIPIAVLVLVLNFLFVSLSWWLIIRFVIGSFLIVVGMSLFLFGVSIGISPIGHFMGNFIAKTNKVWIIAALGFVLGFFISIAEPALHIHASQVELVSSGLLSSGSIVITASIGIAVFLAFGLVRIVYNVALQKLMTVFYGIILVLSLFSSGEFLAISFDASGATTGAMTVPFILTLALGISILKRDSRSSENDSFGLLGVASAGAIISVLLIGIVSNNTSMESAPDYLVSESTAILGYFFGPVPGIAREVLLSLLPILLTFLLLQLTSLRLSRRSVRQITFGLFFTFLGMVIFLVGVNAGFMDVGREIGYGIASTGNKAFVVIVGFILGLVTILAEPSVYVLTHQIEDVTSGAVKRRIVLVALSAGVSLAVGFSMVRIVVPGIQLWHFLLPGYVISIFLSFFSPKLFVGIAFDAGGVASGPMIGTFVLAFAQGAVRAVDGANILLDAFGLISMVAMTPIIALQILGLIYKMKIRKRGVESSDDSRES
ncbi:MAG: DUF1538 domain-containing protein [Thermotogaceae bacterium]|nr:DUF1538 domain-containing protein [Mesotoga sp.]MDI9375610.1 DUF1538 domain-containing protein [Thermotogota bacterium]NLX34831.1 DUF1538 domain-containing protein [Thermotogaceae bacterium]MDD4040814.1 DUF1538 domain-containing protein [Mesotoga sp.]MDD4478055.1 DUF1538 domain-containing protein [Mesotoga sp.]